MKKQFLLLLVVSILGFACTHKDLKPSEEKVLTVINDHMFKTLFYYDSYIPLETAIDSAIHTPYNDTTILRYAIIINESLKQSAECQEQAKKALEIYGLFGDIGIKNHRNPQKEFSNYMEEGISYLDKSVAYNDSIRLGARFINPNFIGWAITHKYYSKDTDTITQIFYTDKECTKITSILNVEDDNYIKCVQIINEILEMK